MSGFLKGEQTRLRPQDSRLYACKRKLGRQRCDARLCAVRLKGGTDFSAVEKAFCWKDLLNAQN